MAFYPLDGPSKQFALSVGSSTPVEVKAGATAWTARKVVTLQPLDGDIYVYFADQGETPNASTISTKGFLHYKYQKDTYEASDTQAIWLVSTSGNVDVRGAERA